MSAVGYPVFSLNDIAEDTLNDDDIDELFIWPALQEYYEYNPIRTTERYSVSATFEVEFPSEETYGVVNHKFLSDMAGTKTTSPFMNSILYQKSSSMTSRSYGTAYNYDISIAKQLENSVMSAEQNQTRSTKINVDVRNKKVTGYSNTGTGLEITWAQYSLDWNDIKFQDENDVIKLCQANVLQFFGDLRNQETGSLPVELDGSDFINRAEDLRQEVIEKWQDRVKGVVLR